MQWTLRFRRYAAARPGRRPLAWRLGALWLLIGLLIGAPAAAADGPATPELGSFEITRGEDGVQLAFSLSFELPRAVEDALQKGVPLYFVAQVELFRGRWYWRDKRIAIAERTWRLAFQPLTRKYRVSFGGLNQSYDSLADALVAVRRVSSWKIADTSALEDGGGHYVEFTYRLDTSQLPRPLQIGRGGLADWNLRIEKFHRID